MYKTTSTNNEGGVDSQLSKESFYRPELYYRQTDYQMRNTPTTFKHEYSEHNSHGGFNALYGKHDMVIRSNDGFDLSMGANENKKPADEVITPVKYEN